jgi:hypothetical protein
MLSCFVRKSGYPHTSNPRIYALVVPTLAKNARMGHPLSGRYRKILGWATPPQPTKLATSAQRFWGTKLLVQVSTTHTGDSITMMDSLRLRGFCILLTLLYAAAAAQTPAPPQKSSQDGLTLLQKMQAALGGADKIAAIHDYEETVRATIWNNSGTAIGEVRKRTRWMQKPNLLRLDQRGPRDTYVLYFDGGSGSGWEMLPDLKNTDLFKTTGESIALVGGELKFAKSYLSGFEFNMWLADRLPGYVVTSPAPHVLRIEHDNTASDFTLDPVTWLPVKSAAVSLADPNRPVPAEMRYGGWTEVAGVRFATQRANYHNGVKLAEETAEEAIRVNVGLKPQDLASKPSTFAPDIPAR